MESVKFESLTPSENDPIVGEVSENQVNIATRQVNMSDISGVVGVLGIRKNCPKNVLALSKPDSAEVDCAAVIGCGNT